MHEAMGVWGWMVYRLAITLFGVWATSKLFPLDRDVAPPTRPRPASKQLGPRAAAPGWAFGPGGSSPAWDSTLPPDGGLHAVRIRDRDQQCGEVLDVQRTRDGAFRLLCTPLLVGLAEKPALRFGDLIELEPHPDGDARYLRRVEIGGYQRSRWFVPPGFLDRPGFQRFSDRLHAAGGEWELIMGGMFFVNLPPGSDFPVREELEQLFDGHATQPEVAVVPPDLHDHSPN